jgi:predicted choloylglycine hydrolase
MVFKVAIVQCRGTPYEIGRAQGELHAATSKGRAFLRRKKFWVPWWFNLDAHKRMYLRFAPGLWEELEGLAEGLGAPLARVALYFGTGQLRLPIGGCSAVMSNGVYGRNYDYRARDYGARLVLVQPTGSYASVGTSEMLTGRLDGMNEHGLCIGLHLIKMRPRFPGLLCVLLNRIVLDQCATTAEAVEMLRRLPHGMQYNYSLLDANGVAAVVEASPGLVAVRTGNWLACTNHFQSALLRPLNRRVRHSEQRLPPLEHWARQRLTVEQTFAALNSSRSPAFFHGYLRGAGTLHTIAVEPASRRMLIGVGGDAAALDEDMLDIDFAAWVKGEDLPVTHLTGQLGGMSLPIDWPPRRSKITTKRRKPAREVADA